MATFEWPLSVKGDNILWKLPENIRLNDNIIVREDEYAVFLRDGKAMAYIDRPDRYALTSLNVPYVGKIVEFLTGFRQGAEVFYLAKKPFEAKFGSKQPYPFRDRDFGIVNLRLFGEFRWKIKEPANFINQFVGTENLATGAQIEERIREQMVVAMFDGLGEMKERGIQVLDLAANLLEIEQIVLAKTKPHFDPYGLEIQKISGLYITLPEEVQKAVDARASMTVTGTGYMQYQSAQAMREAANNPSGGAGAGVGVGAGIAMGYQMAGQMQPTQPGAPPPPMVSGKPCVKCGIVVPTGQKFCGSCGATQEGQPCPKCKAAVPAGQKFCGSCGTPIG